MVVLSVCTDCLFLQVSEHKAVLSVCSHRQRETDRREQRSAIRVAKNCDCTEYSVTRTRATHCVIRHETEAENGTKGVYAPLFDSCRLKSHPLL